MAVAGAAAMAGTAMLPFLALSILGAVIGDFLSFWVGRRFHGRYAAVWPFSRRPTLMESAERFFDRYGVSSVALCRFVPVLRSTVPLFAGMAGMPPRRFFVANVASAFVWAPVHIYPAQLAGLSLAAFGRATGPALRCGAACCWPCGGLGGAPWASAPRNRKRHPSAPLDQPPGAPWVLTYSAYSPWLAAMNRRFRQRPPKHRFAASFRQRDMADRLAGRVEHPHAVQVVGRPCPSRTTDCRRYRRGTRPAILARRR